MTQPVLLTEGLSKAFGANVAVAEVSLAVREGTLHTIIGPNGAGKTTFFNLLTRDLPVSAGHIYYRGDEITALKPHQVAARGVGRSYQITSVFPSLTVLENAWLAAYRKETGGRLDFWSRPGAYTGADDKARAALGRVGLDGVADRPARELSYGDQRLLEIAVTLAAEPKLLLFDEPTSGLSADEARKVGTLVRALVPAYTVVMIEHNMDVVMAVSDRISVMQFGRLIADGDPAQIRDDQRVRDAYLGT
ncbi:MAG: ABC transporter ATP-binding protein [Rhodospirillaceae bacterium]|nr:ABC transporter ATP-binding protein [Rhodospirillaceae bacterium]